jgi:hypothetical protein
VEMPHLPEIPHDIRNDNCNERLMETIHLPFCHPFDALRTRLSQPTHFNFLE